MWTKKDIKRILSGAGILFSMDVYIHTPDLLIKLAFGTTFILCLLLFIED